MLRAYFFETDDWNGCGIAIIAKNMQDARKIACQNDENCSGWVEMCKRIRTIPLADTSGLKEGVFEGSAEEGLKRELYAWYEKECPLCGKFSRLSKSEDGEIRCESCGGEINFKKMEEVE